MQEKLKEYYQVINEAWQIMKKYANEEFDNDIWDKFGVETDAVYKSHGKSEFSKDVLLAVINEIERLEKNEKSNNNSRG